MDGAKRSGKHASDQTYVTFHNMADTNRPGNIFYFAASSTTLVI